MTSTKQIELLFKYISKEFGALKAKQAVTDILYCILDDLIQEGHEVTEKEIEKRLKEEVKFFKKSAKKHAA